MKKTIVLFFTAIVLLLFVGCVNTYGLTETQVNSAYEEYACWAVIKESDSAGLVTGKVFGRGMLDLITIGIFEAFVYEDKEDACFKYYLGTFLGKRKFDVISEFGAPTRSFSDGTDGEILIYERVYYTGGGGYTNANGYYQSNPYRMHKDIKEFYFNADGKCYKWRLKTE